MITLVSQSSSVTLPNPTFSDTSSASGQLTIRRTLDNRQKTYISSSIEQRHNLTIPNITRLMKAHLEDILAESDQLITYTDLEGQDWSGYITNFPFDIVETSSKVRTQQEIDDSEDGFPYDHRYSCTINFRGKKI